MSDKQAVRIIELQRQVKIARAALEKIALNRVSNAVGLADDALAAMWPLDVKQKLQGLVGHERKMRCLR